MMPNTPADDAKASQHVRVVHDHASSENALDKASRLLRDLDPFHRKILVERVLLVRGRRTLQAIGEETGKSRERIRQLETKVKEVVFDALAPEVERIRTIVDGRLIRFDSLLEKLEVQPHLTAEIREEELVDPRVVGVLTLLRASGCEVRGELVGLNSTWQAIAGLSSAQFGDRIPLSTLRRRLEQFITELSPELLASIVVDAGLSVSADGWVQKRPVTLREQLDRVFEQTRRPMTRSELIEATSLADVQIRGLLSRREGYSLVGKGLFAPSSWRLEEYSGTQQALLRALESRGGEASASELINEVVERFSCTRASCELYLSSSPLFDRVGDRIRISARTNEPVKRGDTARQRRVYSDLAEGLVWGIEVDNEMLRGSGRQVPPAVANALGLKTHGAVKIDAPGCELTIKLGGTTIQISSLRVVAETIHAERGDRLLLRLPTGSGYRFDLVRHRENRGLALRLVGQPPDDDDPLLTIARACWSVDAHLLIETLWDREETQVLEALGMPVYDVRGNALDVDAMDRLLRSRGVSRSRVAVYAGLAAHALTPDAGERLVRLSSRERTLLLRYLAGLTGEDEGAVGTRLLRS